ncbi:MAG: SH3 domain-containing protein, partial [Butyrivibrio sp.]|nr:SH3 domain-containing protein [Butyrivibrio sp.]
MKRVISILLVLGMMFFAFIEADAQRAVMQVKEPQEAAAEAPAEAETKETAAPAVDQVQAKTEPEKKEETKAEPDKKEEAKAETKSEPETEKDPAEDTQAAEKSFDDKDIVRNETPVTMYVKSPVNVRSGPSTDYDIVGNVTEGTELEVLGRYTDKGWYLINYNGQEAFVSHN